MDDIKQTAFLIYLHDESILYYDLIHIYTKWQITNHIALLISDI